MASTTNVTLQPGSNWTLVVTGAVTSFFSIRHQPKHSVVFFTVATSLPANTVKGGFRSDCGEFWANGALAAGTNVYARIQNNANDQVDLSVYQN